METKYKYNPSDYVDYLCESMTDFYAALPTGNCDSSIGDMGAHLL